MTTRIITDSNGRKHITNEPLLHPPQRQWVGLTDEQIGEIAVKSQEGVSPHDDTLRFARAIEAKLKEKNNAL